jgi:hypothetical protein
MKTTKAMRVNPRLALVLATGLWPLLHPPTALAAGPVTLTLKGQWPGYARGFARDVAVAGTHAYVADGDAGLQVIDVSNSANPVRVDGYDTSGDASAVAVAGKYAYVAEWVAEGLAVFEVIDVSNPANPVRVGGVDAIWNPADPMHVGNEATDLAVVGNYAYVTFAFLSYGGFHPGLLVIDISNPANPVPVGRYDASGGQICCWQAWRVAVAGNYAYVVGSRYGETSLITDLQVIDVSDPANPVRVGGIDTGGSVTGVAVAGSHAYLGESRWEGDELISGLQVIDVSNPANPVRVDGFDTGGSVTGVAVAGNHAYVASHAGLQAIDVTDSANPVRLGSYPTSGFDSAVAVAGDLIYVADGPWGLLIVEQSAAPPPPAQWVRIPTDPASTPAGRESAAMVYDEQRERIVMHGGIQRQGLPSPTSAQRHLGMGWQDVDAGFHQRSQVLLHNMAYDAYRGVSVLYGGRWLAGRGHQLHERERNLGVGWMNGGRRSTPARPIPGPGRVGLRSRAKESPPSRRRLQRRPHAPGPRHLRVGWHELDRHRAGFLQARRTFRHLRSRGQRSRHLIRRLRARCRLMDPRHVGIRWRGVDPGR